MTKGANGVNCHPEPFDFAPIRHPASLPPQDQGKQGRLREGAALSQAKGSRTVHGEILRRCAPQNDKRGRSSE